MSRFSIRALLRCCFASACLCAALSAGADLLVDPTGGTSLVFSDADNGVRTRPLGFTGTFFGDAKTTVDICVNGHLNFTSNTSFADGSFPRSTARIAPLWDDLVLNTSSAILEQTNPGVFYSITWSNVFRVTSLNPSKTDTFQAVWFGATTTIGGFTFQKDDIAFAYAQVNADFDGGVATVGINKGSANAAAVLPGTTNGVITAAQKNLLPLVGSQFVLFRPNGAGGYGASITSAGATTATVTGKVALEGVSDLTKINATAAPLGTFAIQFRTPATLTIVKEFAAVSLTATAGSAYGSFSVSGVPAGTYDVWIKGKKNLAVLNPDFVVSGATATVPNSILGAGDSDNNNAVDVLDFGNLVNAYGTDSAQKNGYDPNADFDFNGVVDVLDFGLLVNEYGVTGSN